MEAGRGRLCKAARRAWSVAARSGHCRASRGRRTASPPHSCPEQAVRALDAVRSAVSAARARGQPARVNETSYDQCPTRPTTVTQRFPKPSTRILGHSGSRRDPDDLQLAVLDDERHSTDRSNSPVPFSAAQFRVLLGRSQTPVPLTSTSITSGVLQPSSNIDEQLSFVVPRTNQAILLEYRDPDGRTIKIRVGHTDQAPL